MLIKFIFDVSANELKNFMFVEKCQFKNIFSLKKIVRIENTLGKIYVN